MRILLINTGAWGTGSFTVAQATLEELLRLGHEVKFFFPDSGIPHENKDYFYSHPELFEIWKFPIKNEKITLESFPLIIPDPNPRSPEGKTFLELTEEELELYTQEFKKNLEKLIHEFRPDVIECQHIWLMAYLVGQLGHKYICNALHSDQIAFRYDYKMQEIAKEAAKNSEYIFAHSKYIKEDVVSIYGVDAEKIAVICPGYDAKIFKPFSVDRDEVLKELGLSIPKDAKIVSFVGAISRTKGVDIILLANRLINPKEEIHFLLSGGGNGDGNKDKLFLSDRQRSMASFERTHFLGHQPPKMIAKIHNISRLSVLPSRSEGFGIACLEAMACGLPTIVTKTSNAVEYAIGKIINSECPEELADAIVNIVHMPKEDYAELSGKCISESSKFCWKDITKQRIEYYLKIKNKEDK